MSSLYNFLEPGQLLENPDSTQYAHFWMQARADTFQKANRI